MGLSYMHGSRFWTVSVIYRFIYLSRSHLEARVNPYAAARSQVHSVSIWVCLGLSYIHMSRVNQREIRA